jgi:4-diphosphocytidyl-2-C-methyl-D-erythritol kinase
LSTASAFKGFKDRKSPFVTANRFDQSPKDVEELAGMLENRQNGLTEAACAMVPEIHTALLALETSPNCLISRMSGSGATCFGLYPDRASARNAAAKIFAAHPNWWVTPTYMPYRQGV